MKKVAVLFFILGFLTLWSVVILVANDIAIENPIIREILKIKEKEVPVGVVKEKIVYVEKEVHWFQFHATGYSPDDPSQGTNRIMSSGNEVYEGAVATDPTVIPTGTKLEIRGLPNARDGFYIAEDVGGAIKGLRLDIFCESKFEALQINQMVWVRILE